MIVSLLLLLAGQSPDRLPPANALPPPGTVEAAVIAPIDALFAAFEAGDAAAMMRHVDPEGRVTAVGRRPDGSGAIRKMSMADFAAQRVKPEAAFQERITNPAIEIDGDVAMVWAPFTVHVAGKLASCGYDLFDLVREDGRWKVMNVTFSSRTTGCEAQ